MLTSLFYYEHYRPYMFNKGNRISNNKQAVNERVVAKDNSKEAAEVSLNKSLNKDVVKYAKNIYRNTTELKYTSKKIASDLRNYVKFKNKGEFDQEEFEKGFDEDLEKFANSYSKSIKFLKNQKHSTYLGSAANKLERVTEESKKIMNVMGFSNDEEGNLVAGTSRQNFWNGRNTEAKIEAAESLFDKMREETTEILENPMAKHMNFKSLNYYYNYEVDKVRVDSFQIIKTGLLVNLAL